MFTTTFKLALLTGAVLGALAVASVPLHAATTTPTPAAQVDRSTGSPQTGSAITVLGTNSCGGASGCRTDCFFQNKSTHVMYYSFTGTATTSSKQLQPLDSINCLNGVTVDQGALSTIGTAGDTYSATESYAVAQ